MKNRQDMKHCLRIRIPSYRDLKAIVSPFQEEWHGTYEMEWALYTSLDWLHNWKLIQRLIAQDLTNTNVDLINLIAQDLTSKCPLNMALSTKNQVVGATSVGTLM